MIIVAFIESSLCDRYYYNHFILCYFKYHNHRRYKPYGWDSDRSSKLPKVIQLVVAEDSKPVWLESVWLQNLFLRVGRGHFRSPTGSPIPLCCPSALSNLNIAGFWPPLVPVTGPSDCSEPTSTHPVLRQDCLGMMTSPNTWSPRRWNASPGFVPQSSIQGTGRHPFPTTLSWQRWQACDLPERWRKAGGTWTPKPAGWGMHKKSSRMVTWHAYTPGRSRGHPWGIQQNRGT